MLEHEGEPFTAGRACSGRPHRRAALLDARATATSIDLTEGVLRGRARSRASSDGVVVGLRPRLDRRGHADGVRARRRARPAGALDRLVPREGDYEHNRLNADTNSHAHIRAAVVGPSETVPLAAGGSDRHLAAGRAAWTSTTARASARWSSRSSPSESVAPPSGRAAGAIPASGGDQMSRRLIRRPSPPFARGAVRLARRGRATPRPRSGPARSRTARCAARRSATARSGSRDVRKNSLGPHAIAESKLRVGFAGGAGNAVTVAGLQPLRGRRAPTALLVRGRGVTSRGAHREPGRYQVIFNRDVRGCAVRRHRSACIGATAPGPAEMLARRAWPRTSTAWPCARSTSTDALGGPLVPPAGGLLARRADRVWVAYDRTPIVPRSGDLRCAAS